MTSPITLARQASWDAVNSWAKLKDGNGQSVFVRQDRFEDVAAPARETIESAYGPGDLPAIAFITDSLNLTWETNQRQTWFLDVTCHVWTPDWNLLLAEKYTPEIINALYAATPSGASVSFVKNPTTGTGYDPAAVPSVKFVFAAIGKENKTKAIRTDITFRLRMLFSPFEQ